MKRKNIFYFTFILVGLFIISTLLSFSHHLNIHLIDYSKPKEWGRKIDSVESTPKSSLLIEGDRSCDIVPPFFDDFERYNVGINACWINATSPITETITYNPTDTSIAFRYDTIYRYDTNYVPGQVYQYFNYTGSPQNWTVPAGITTVGLSLWGAQGGDGGQGTYTQGIGGKGGYAAGTLSVSPGDVLTFIIGQRGGTALSFPSCPNCPGGNGGYGSGGGAGGGWCSNSAAGGGGGGGFSMVKKNNNIVMVAGGGGGGGGSSSSSGSSHGAGGNGGAGGGTDGINGSPSSGNGYYGYGASQYSGGSAGSSGSSGSYLMGGGAYGYSSGSSGNSSSYTGGTGGSGGCSSSAGGSGGGGGGYYGGGGGGYYSSGGGGGSGYIGGVTNGTLIAGNTTIPDTNGQTMVGKADNGMGAVAYLGTVMGDIDTIVDQIVVAETLIVFTSKCLLLEKMSQSTTVVSSRVMSNMGDNVDISFVIYCDATQTVKLGTMPDQITSSSFQEFYTLNTEPRTWKSITITDVPISTTHRYIAFRSSGQHEIYVDDISFSVRNTSSISNGSMVECSITPNPFYDKLIISSTSFIGEVDLQLFDIQGKNVYSATIPEITLSTEIKIPELKSGIYMIKLTDKTNRTFTQKMIRN